MSSTIPIRYLVERTIVFILTILTALTLIFLIPRMVPGDPLAVYYDNLRDAGAQIGAEKMIEEYRAMLGLDKDLFTQYINYLLSILRGDLGYSIARFPAKVSDLIMAALPWSIGLLAVSLTLSWAVGTIIGAFAGWTKRKRLASVIGNIALFLSIIPYYIFAILLIFIFAYTLRIFPSGGGYSPGVIPSISPGFILNVIWHATLPALSIIISELTWWLLSMRAMITTVKGEDFIVLAEAKGLPERRIMWNYAVKNSILPQVTGLAINISRVFAGALITEVVFRYPGLGTLIATAITSLDYFLIQGTIVFSIIAVTTANYVIELLYPLLDPRIRYGGR